MCLVWNVEWHFATVKKLKNAKKKLQEVKEFLKLPRNSIKFLEKFSSLPRNVSPQVFLT